MYASFVFYLDLNRTFCKQIHVVKILIRHRIMRSEAPLFALSHIKDAMLIWVKS